MTSLPAPIASRPRPWLVLSLAAVLLAGAPITDAAEPAAGPRLRKHFSFLRGGAQAAEVEVPTGSGETLRLRCVGRGGGAIADDGGSPRAFACELRDPRNPTADLLDDGRGHLGRPRGAFHRDELTPIIPNDPVRGAKRWWELRGIRLTLIVGRLRWSEDPDAAGLLDAFEFGVLVDPLPG